MMINTTVNLIMMTSTPRRVWKVSPPPPHALPSPAPRPWIRIKATMVMQSMILTTNKISFIGGAIVPSRYGYANRYDTFLRIDEPHLSYVAGDDIRGHVAAAVWWEDYLRRLQYDRDFWQVQL